MKLMTDDRKNVEVYDLMLTLGRTHADDCSALFDNIHNLVFHGDRIMTYALARYCNLETFYSDNLTTLDDLVFHACKKLSIVSMPRCSIIGYEVFGGCSNLREIHLDSCERIGERTFQNCKALTYIHLPRCQYIGKGAFEGCSSLRAAYLPECLVMYELTFSGCSELETVIAPKCGHVCELAFVYCPSIRRLIVSSRCRVNEFASVLAYGYVNVIYGMSPVDADRVWNDMHLEARVRYNPLPTENVRKIRIDTRSENGAIRCTVHDI